MGVSSNSDPWTKDPAAVVPPELRETLVAEVIQDQISSAHPVGALAVSPILDAVGVLHAEPRLVVLPDDSRLGEFRGEFAGMLGIIEERPDESDSELASFAGASNVVGTDRLLERIEEDPRARRLPGVPRRASHGRIPGRLRSARRPVAVGTLR